jgi:hypothetical protein
VSDILDELVAALRGFEWPNVVFIVHSPASPDPSRSSTGRAAPYPGSVRTRFSERKPQSHAYAPLAPVLHYNAAQGDLVGGNFWDMRATGRRLGNPAAEQAQGPVCTENLSSIEGEGESRKLIG